MKRSSLCLCLLALVILLCACGAPKNTVSLLDPLAVSDAAQRLNVTLSVYDGERVKSTRLLDRSEGGELLDRLRAVPAQPELTAPVPITLPVYGITGEKPDGTTFRLAFIEDYCITEDGLFYRFWFDFADALGKGSWTWSDGSFAEFPCASLLFVEDNGITAPTWRTELLPAAPEQTITPPAGITASLVDWSGVDLTVSFRNDSGAIWTYGDEYRIEFAADGVWYTLPYAMTDYPLSWWLISYSLADSQTAEETYNVNGRYGVPACHGYLPVGRYRIITNGLAVEFEAK